MATALTGSLGWTGLHPVQLGGPPLIHNWSRALASGALPLLAHAYGNDGVTPATTSATFPILNRPPIKATLANGGYEQVTLEVSAPIAGLTQGNVVRLTELGGPFSGFVYGGIVESFPDVRSSSGTKHQIVLTPFGAELTRVAVQLRYDATTNSGVDIAQVVRDAVALTQHCSCDQVSVPVATGIPLVSTSGGQVDFHGQKVGQVLDACRSIAGPTWFWYCDELGRVWFQPQGSAAVYTLMGGQHYEERATNGGSVTDRINRVQVVGGVPTGGSANVQATYDGASQAALGVRALDPAVQAPGITDQATIAAVAAGIGATLDQVWTRVALKALPSLAQRVHGSQPGGAMLRYWEPARHPLPESTGASTYMSTVEADAPAAYWRLGDGAGASTVADQFVLDPGTVNGGTTLGVAGALSGDTDTAASLNGSTGWISVAGPGNLVPLFRSHDWSVEAWIKPTALSSWWFAVGVDNAASADAFLHVGFDASSHAKVGFFGDDLVGGRTLATGQWWHVVVTWRATTKRREIWINGALDAADTSAGTLDVTASGTVAFGRALFGPGNGPFWYAGALDEVAVYPVVLNSGQIAAHYKVGTSGPVAVGGYTGPFIVQSVDYDGLIQSIEAGNIPVTSQTDIDHMVQTWANRTAVNALQVTGAALNLQQTLTGSLQSGTGTTVINANGQLVPASLWNLSQTEFSSTDPNGIVRAEMGNLGANGVSPAQWGFRANDASGNPIFDSLGLIAVAQLLGKTDGPTVLFTTSSGAPVSLTWTPITFTLTRQLRVLCLATGAASVGGAGSQGGFIDLFLDGTDLSAGTPSVAPMMSFPTTAAGAASAMTFYTATLAAGSHTFELKAWQNGAGTASISVTSAHMIVLLLGT